MFITGFNHLMKIKFIFSVLLIIVFSGRAFAEDIIIGIDADMSASAAVGGEAIYRGAKIAVNEINSHGGVLGKKLVIKVKDHRANPRRGVQNIEELLKDKNLVAVLGGVHTPVAMSQLELIHKNQLIYLSPWAAGTALVDNGYQPNYVFRLSVRDADAGEVLINHAKSRGLTRIGLLLERTVWGESNIDALITAAVNQGVDIVQTQWFNWSGDSFVREIKRFKESNTQAVIFVGNTPEGAVFARDLADFDDPQELPIISHWGIASGDFVTQVGLDKLSTLDLSVLQTISFVKPKNTKKAQYVLKQYKETFDKNATVESIPAVAGVVHAYDLVHLLALAITDANTIQRDKVRDALENIKNYDGLIRFFDKPFSKDNHDALGIEDYILTRFNDRGFLTPIQ